MARDFINPPKIVTGAGVSQIDYQAWGKDEPPLEHRPSQVKDIRDNRDPETIGSELLKARRDAPEVPFHELCDEMKP
jgi:hypothetical protein